VSAHRLTRPPVTRTTPIAERPALWLVTAGIGAVGVGALTSEDARIMFDVVLAAIAIVAFLRWPYALLLLVLAAGFDDPRALEIGTLIGGGVAVIVAGRRALAATLPICFLLLLAIALPRIPLHPTVFDGAGPPELYLPFSHVGYLGSPSNAMESWLQLAFLLVAFALGAWLITDRRRLHQAVWISLASSAIPVIVGLQQFATGQYHVRPGTSTQAVEGPFPHPNAFAFYLLLPLVVGLVMLIETRATRIRLALAALLIGAGVCLFLTYTRSAWIGFAVALLILGIFRYRWLIVIGTIALIVAAFAFPGAVHAVDARFGDLSAQSAGNSTSSYSWRTGEWKRMVPYGLHHPFIGTGFGTYAADTYNEFGTEDLAYPTVANPGHPATSPKGFSAHNDYVRMLVELGFPGLVLWSLVLLSLLVLMLRACRVLVVRPLALALAAMVVALIGISYSDNVQSYTVDLLYPLALGGGVASIARRERRRPAPASDAR
jgi:O-antigen ligase